MRQLQHDLSSHAIAASRDDEDLVGNVHVVLLLTRWGSKYFRKRRPELAVPSTGGDFAVVARGIQTPSTLCRPSTVSRQVKSQTPGFG